MRTLLVRLRVDRERGVSLAEMLVVILLLGLAYAWRRGALEWT